MAEIIEIIKLLSQDYECIIHVNLRTDTDTHYKVADIFSSRIAGWNEENSYTERIRLISESLIPPDEQKKFLRETERDAVREGLKDGHPYLVFFKAKIDGVIRWYQAKYVRSPEEEEEDCVYISISDCTDAMRKRMRDKAIIEALGEDFLYISYIEPRTLREEIYRLNADFARKIPGWDDITTYSERMRLVCENYVHPDDKEYFIRETNIDNVIRKLRKKPVMHISYREVIDGETVFFQGKYVLLEVDGIRSIVTGYRIERSTFREHLLKQEMLTDELTGLQNRRAFYDCIAKLDEAAPVGVVFCDINSLKYVNDSFGHEKGDELILEMAALLRNAFESESVFHVSGDEFIVISCDKDQAAFTEREEHLKTLISDSGVSAATGAEFGEAKDLHRLLKQAELRMYDDKKAYYESSGNNRRRK